MSDIFQNMWKGANDIADAELAERIAGIEGSADKGEASQDTRCAKDWIEFARSSTKRPEVTACEWIDRNLFDAPSMDILATIILYVDEDGQTPEDESSIVSLMDRIERSNMLMTRWEQMIETQLVAGTPANSLIVDPTRLVHYIRAMGFVNPWDKYHGDE